MPTEESGLAPNPASRTIDDANNIDRLGRSNSKLTHLDDDEAVTASTILPELEAALTEETTISN